MTVTPYLVASAHKMVDDMRGRGVAASATEPLIAYQALDYAGWRVYSTVCTGMSGKLSIIVNRNQAILFAVVAVTKCGAADRHTDQAESIVYRVFVIIVASCLKIVHRRCLDSGSAIVEVVTCHGVRIWTHTSAV